MNSTQLDIRRTLVSSLEAWWADAFDRDVTTIYPGMQIDTTQLPVWAELWVQSSQQRVQRSAALPLVDVSVSVHLFCRTEAPYGRLRELVDQACQLLSLRTLFVRDFTRQGLPVVGYLKLFEPETRTMPRSPRSEHSELQHTLITCPGLAQLLTSD